MITFDPFWETLKKKNISQYTLLHDYGLSHGTLSSIKQNKSITLNTLNELCRILDCNVDDIIIYKAE